MLASSRRTASTFASSTDVPTSPAPPHAVQLAGEAPVVVAGLETEVDDHLEVRFSAVLTASPMLPRGVDACDVLDFPL